MQKTPLGEALFTQSQQKVLGLLFGNPERTFYTNEIVRWSGMGVGTIKRELERLESAGLLQASVRGNQKHYQANHACPIFSELRAIVRKTFGIRDVLMSALSPLMDRVDLAFVYGSIARGTDTASSDIDLMVVTESLSYAELMEALAEAEEKLGRPVNPTVYDKKQLQDKLNDRKAFVQRVIEQPKLWIKGSEDDVGKIR